MRKKLKLFAASAILLGAFAAGHAQQKSSPSELKIQIVFTEYDNGQKVTSLPYSFTAVGDTVNPGPGRQAEWMAHVRLGVSVPIATQNKEGESQVQYQDVGTNIDFLGTRYEDGRYKLTFSVERSSIYVPDNSGKDPNLSAGAGLGSSLTPLLRRYRGSFDVLMRDGQTVQGPVATDPQTGRVLKSEVTLNVAN